MQRHEELAETLCLYGNTPLWQAYDTPVSVAEGFFKGKPFRDWKKVEESKTKLWVGIADRLNEVIRACGVIVKTIAKTR